MVRKNSQLISEKLKRRALEKGYNSNSKIEVKCIICNKSFRLKHKNVVANKRRNNGEYHCNSCSLVLAHKGGRFDDIYNDDHKRKLRESSDKFWVDNRGKWRDRIVNDEFRQKMSECGKRAWSDEFRERMKELRSTPEFKKKQSMWGKSVWTREFKERRKEWWKKCPKMGRDQYVLYSMLDDLGVKYEKEYFIEDRPYDCFIFPQGFVVNPIVIEVQGNWIHSLPGVIKRDKSKATYLKKNYPTYDLKYIWEHEFDNRGRVVSLLRYWLGLSEPSKVDFVFKNVVIKLIDYKEAELFISKYHYAGRVGRSGVNVGFYLGGVLVGVCIFSHPVRQEVASRQGLKYKQVFELSRLAIHPSFQKKNFASFIIGKSIKLVRRDRPEVLRLVSFADSTYNHDGAIYRASNWVLDGMVPPDYWYVDKDGYVCHKRTLWSKAKQMRMTEGEYCAEHGYQKVYGDEKYRYIYMMGL